MTIRTVEIVGVILVSTLGLSLPLFPQVTGEEKAESQSIPAAASSELLEVEVDPDQFTSGEDHSLMEVDAVILETQRQGVQKLRLLRDDQVETVPSEADSRTSLPTDKSPLMEIEVGEEQSTAMLRRELLTSTSPQPVRGEEELHGNTVREDEAFGAPEPGYASTPEAEKKRKVADAL